MLQAFLDESGKDEPFCAVAGYFGGENQWKKLARAWSRVVEKAGVSEFHAKYFWPRAKEFKGWPDDKHSWFINALLEIIEQTRIYPVAGAISFEEWDRLSVDERRFLTGATYRGKKLVSSGKPTQRMFLPVHHCFIRPTMHCKAGIVMTYAFDIDEGNKSWTTQLYNYIRNKDVSEETRKKMGSAVSFVDSASSPEVQAADLLSWEVHRFGVEVMKNPKARGRQEFRRAISRVRSGRDFELYDKPKIESFLRYFREKFR